MKKNIRLFSILFIVAFSFNVKANVYQQLLSGDISQIKRASQTMTVGRENSRENADILAEILYSKFENVTDSEVDTLSWACKALAATSDGRYKQLLMKISESNTHKKLRKYAQRSYKTLSNSNEAYTKGTIDLAVLLENEKSRLLKAGVLFPNANLNQTERKLFFIAKGDLNSIRSIARNIHKSREANKEVADTLSEFLLSKYTKPAKYQVDTLAWICRALGQLDNGRYTSVVELVSEKSSVSKVRDYARSAYKSLPKATNSYVKGSVNLEEIVKKYKA